MSLCGGPLFLIRRHGQKLGVVDIVGVPLCQLPTHPHISLLCWEYLTTVPSLEVFSADKSWMALRPWLVTGGQGLRRQSLCLKVTVVLVMPLKPAVGSS